MGFTTQQIDIIKRCQQSCNFFLRNFGKIKHPSAGILPFYPFSYQRNAIKAFRENRLNIFRKCRQAGASKIAGAFALWFGMFYPNKKILIVSRKNDDAMGFLRENIVFPYNNLPEWMKQLWEPQKINEHEIVFPNNSHIQSLTSHPDVLRSHASSLNILDEVAFIPQMDAMWASGWPCSRGDTLIQTDEGLIKIEEIAGGGDPWKDIDLKVATDSGYKQSNKGYVSGRKPTTIINSYLGFEFEGADHHRIRIIDDNGDYVWQRLDGIKPGDIIVSMPNQFKGRRRFLNNKLELNEEIAEIIGLYIGDGTLSINRPKRFKIFFDPQDYETRDKIIDQFNRIFDLEEKAYSETATTTENLRLNSAEFIEFMVSNGLNNKTCPQDAQIPSIILKSDESVLCAFIRGLFDSDGWCYKSSTCLKLGFSTTSKKLAEQVQVCLHSLGIISRRKLIDNSSSKNEDRYSDEPYWRVEIWDAHSKAIYRDKIGFISHRKLEILKSYKGSNEYSEIFNMPLVREFAMEAKRAMLNGSSFRRCSDPRKWNLCRIAREGRVRLSLVKELSEEFGLECRLSEYVRNGYYFDTVTSVYRGEDDLYDISVPENNTYLANGIVSHNTLQHGGSVIAISTTNGLGGWYWSTMTSAEAGMGNFNPIVINWWDMDWAIEYQDALTKKPKRIAPRDGIRECRTKSEIERYGPYWSPWLEEQWQALQSQGEGWKFEQEILARFVGSGNTIIDKGVLAHIATTVEEPDTKIKGNQIYVHPVSGENIDLNFDFETPEEGFWVWNKPVLAKPSKMRGNTIVEYGSSAHSYVMGVDISTGKGRDYCTIEVFDVDTRDQVAEFMARVLPRELAMYADMIGRYFNTALMVVERNNGGDIIIDELRYTYMYPRLWRKKEINDKPQPMSARRRKARPLKVGTYGFMTTSSSKPSLNKLLVDFIRETDDGWRIHSSRLLNQFQTYVRKRDRAGKDTNKTEAEEGVNNFDDLVIATALAFVGANDAVLIDSSNLLPTGSNTSFTSATGPTILTDISKVDIQQEISQKGGPSLLMPMTLAPDEVPEVAAQRVIDAYTIQLGGIPISQGKPLVTPPKYFYTRDK